MRVVVVGAGIVGASTAYHLSRQGAEVVLVDRGDQGQATAAGAGIICPWLSNVDNPDWHRLAVASARYYPELIDRLAEDGCTDTGYRMVGALRLADSPAGAAQLAARARQALADAPEIGDVSELGPGEASALFPPLAEEWSAVHLSGAARIDGRRIRDALLAAGERHGVQRQTGSAHIGVDGSWRLAVDGVSTAADAVVIAAGAWSAQALLMPGAAVPVEPQRGQIVHLTLSGADTGGWPVVLPPSRHYLLAFDDSRVVVGATRETGAGFDHRVTAAGLREVLDEALLVAPGLASATVSETRIGFRPAAVGDRPLIGPVADGVPIVVATGLGATGLTMGPLTGALAAAAALGAEPLLDLAPYHPVVAL